MNSKAISFLLLPLVVTVALQANDPFDDPFFKDPFGDNIFEEMMQMQQNMDKMFERMHQRIQKRSSGALSPVGTYKLAAQNQLADKGDHYEFVTNIPESKENHIDIKTENDSMSITAKIIQEHEKKTVNSVSSSRSVRMYQQSIPLPKDADDAAISTEYKNGKLVVKIEKRAGAKALKDTHHKSRENNTSKPLEKKEKEKENNVTEESSQTIKKTTLGDQTSMS